jgi:hypothetical protein
MSEYTVYAPIDGMELHELLAHVARLIEKYGHDSYLKVQWDAETFAIKVVKR